MTRNSPSTSKVLRRIGFILLPPGFAPGFYSFHFIVLLSSCLLFYKHLGSCSYCLALCHIVLLLSFYLFLIYIFGLFRAPAVRVSLKNNLQLANQNWPLFCNTLLKNNLTVPKKHLCSDVIVFNFVTLHI